mgnify:CR=1 FL=1
MSWIVKDKSHKRISAGFHERRMRKEGFVSGYVQPTPEWMFFKTVSLYPTMDIIGARKYYYMSLKEVVDNMLVIERQLLEDNKEELVAKSIKVAREVGLAKDYPLISAHLLSKDNIAFSLEKTPPHLLLRFVLIARRAPDLVGGLGRRKKGAVSKIMEGWGTDKLEYYAVRYRNVIKDLVRLVHPKLSDPTANKIVAWTLRKAQAPTPYIKAYEEFLRTANSDPDRALDIAIDNRLPYEVVRANIPINKVRPDKLAYAMIRIASPITAYMNLSTIARAGNDLLALSVASKHADRVPLTYGYKAVIGLASQGHVELAKSIEDRLKSRTDKVIDEISLPIEKPRKSAVFLIDMSGSMSGSPIRQVMNVAYPLRSVSSEVLVFNSDKMPPEPVELKTIDDYFRILEMPDGGTPLEEAVKYAVREARRLDSMLFIFTDEMGNIFRDSNIVKVPDDVPTLVFNPTPYPTEHIVKDYGHVVGLPASSIDTARAGVSLLQLNKVQSEGIEFVDIVDTLLSKLTRQKT